jgi:type II secretory pathway pseudopilin PulG
LLLFLRPSLRSAANQAKKQENNSRSARDQAETSRHYQRDKISPPATKFHRAGKTKRVTRRGEISLVEGFFAWRTSYFLLATAITARADSRFLPLGMAW